MAKTNDDCSYIYGIDLGSYYTVVSKCANSSNNCKIDILQNCLFHRTTPYYLITIYYFISNCIVIHDKQYFIGESAQRLVYPLLLLILYIAEKIQHRMLYMRFKLYRKSKK